MLPLARIAGGAIPERSIAVSKHMTLPRHAADAPDAISVGWRANPHNDDAGVFLLGGFSVGDVALMRQEEHSIMAWGTECFEEPCEQATGALGQLRVSRAEYVTAIDTARGLCERSCYELFLQMDIEGWQWRPLPVRLSQALLHCRSQCEHQVLELLDRGLAV